MQRLLTIAAVLAALVYALVLGVKWLSPKIEADLTNRLTTELAQSGQLWAAIDVHGREVTLTGQAPTPDAKEAARNAVGRVFGIAKVADLTTLPGQEVSGSLIVSASMPVAKLSRAEARALAAAEKAYQLTITKQGNTLTLKGAVPTDADKALLLRLAELHFPEAKLETAELVVDAKGAPAGWRSAAGTVLFNMANLEAAEAKLVGREIMVSGTVLAADFAQTAEEHIRNAVPEQYRVAFVVETTAPVETAAAEEPATEETSVAETATAEEPKEATEAVATEAKTEAKTEATAEVKPEPAKPVATVAAQAPTDAQLAAIEPAAGPVAATADCATLKNVEREVLHFAFDSAKIRAVDAGRVTAVATELRKCGSGKVEVQGYTDKTGSATYNQWLSLQRAESTVRALVRQGAKREQMNAKGFGETTQFGAQNAKTTRAENRRVMFKAQ